MRLAAKLGQPSCSLSNVCSGEHLGHNLSISLLLLPTEYHSKVLCGQEGHLFNTCKFDRYTTQ